MHPAHSGLTCMADTGQVICCSITGVEGRGLRSTAGREVFGGKHGSCICLPEICDQFPFLHPVSLILLCGFLVAVHCGSGQNRTMLTGVTAPVIHSKDGLWF